MVFKGKTCTVGQFIIALILALIVSVAPLALAVVIVVWILKAMNVL